MATFRAVSQQCLTWRGARDNKDLIGKLAMETLVLHNLQCGWTRVTLALQRPQVVNLCISRRRVCAYTAVRKVAAAQGMLVAAFPKRGAE